MWDNSTIKVAVQPGGAGRIYEDRVYTPTTRTVRLEARMSSLSHGNSRFQLSLAVAVVPQDLLART